MLRTFVFVTLAVVLTGGSALAQGKTHQPVSPAAKAQSAPVEEADDKKWAFSASAMTYFIPDDRNYVQPTITADRGRLHFEARYNYENFDTGSAWLGFNFSGGKKLAWEFTPMLGGVFGRTTGVAPGYKGSVNWWKLAFSSEGEYVIDTRNSRDSFFYNWSELTLAPVEWFQFGMVMQHTRVYQSDLEFQRGVLVRFLFKKMNLTGYVLDPDSDNPTLIFSVGVDF